MACPKSIITSPSLKMLEHFRYWKLAGGGSVMNEEARIADAIMYLNELWMEEEQNGQTEE